MSLRVGVASTSRLPSLATSLPSLCRSYGRRKPNEGGELVNAPHLRRFLPPPREPVPIFNPAVTDPLPTTPTWKPETRRAGLIGIKKGMTTIWDPHGTAVGVTIIQVKECQIISINKRAVKGRADLKEPDYHMVQVGSENLKRYEINPKVRRRLGLAPTRKKLPYKTTATMIGHYTKIGIEPKKKVVSFKVTKDALAPIGTEFSVCHFVPGQMVDVKGTSKGQGTAGVMKRWNYSGGTMSHGNSKAHRSAGSMGQNTSPGRVIPGKKASGRMGSISCTTQNSLVQRIDTTLNLIYLRGNVPGNKGSYVVLKDALKGVRWQAQRQRKKGVPLEEALEHGVRTLPMPMGDRKLAEGLPVVVDAAKGKVKKGFENF